jgi:hypothetical protein
MKKILVLSLCIGLSLLGFSQSRYSFVQFNKKDVPAISAEIGFKEETTADAIFNNLEKRGYKSKKAKDDFRLFSGVSMKELGEGVYDIYIQVVRKSRQEKEVSTVTMLISKGYENFATDESDSALIANAKVYILSLRNIAAEYDLELQIKDQEDVVKKTDKKFVNLTDDGISLQKKKKKLEDDITQNTNEVANQKSECEKQKQILDTLKSKKK